MSELNELDLLKQRATDMGISFHPSIGLDTLKEKVNAKLQGASEEAPVTAVGVETRAQKYVRLRKEATKLIRVRVSNMNPDKKGWEGEVITVSNSAIGTVKKYVLFDEPWHVEDIIYKQLLARKLRRFRYKKGQVQGQKIKESYETREFSVEVLAPLTKEELAELASQQALSGSID